MLKLSDNVYGGEIMGLFSKLFKKKPTADEHEKFLKDEFRTGAEKEQNVAIELVDLEADKKTSAPKTIKTNEAKIKTSKPKKTVESKTAESQSASEPTPAEQKRASSQRGLFQIKKSKDGRYVFNLYAANKVIVATSQTYSSSQSAYAGIKSVIANAKRAGVEDTTLKNHQALPFPKWEIYKDKIGEYRFRLNAPNGSCICHSQGYNQKSSCKNGIASIIRTCESADIDKAYLDKE